MLYVCECGSKRRKILPYPDAVVTLIIAQIVAKASTPKSNGGLGRNPVARRPLPQANLTDARIGQSQICMAISQRIEKYRIVDKQCL
jgi:hypothetical protein